MYIPKKYVGESQKEAVDFMRRFNFAVMITTIDDLPVATHLPFSVKEQGDQIILTSHFAKANNHWKHIESKASLIIFSEPHAYISPTNYEHTENVPTWNYMSVHVYGKAKIANEKAISILEDMMRDSEPEFLKQWNTLSEDYKSRMIKGIVPFEFHVEKLQFKEKLSQNKKESERTKIIESLGKSSLSNERLVGEYMKLKEE